LECLGQEHTISIFDDKFNDNLANIVEQAPLASLPVSFAASGISSSSFTPPLYNPTTLGNLITSTCTMSTPPVPSECSSLWAYRLEKGYVNWSKKTKTKETHQAHDLKIMASNPAPTLWCWAINEFFIPLCYLCINTSWNKKTINVVLQYRGWSEQICYTFPLRCLPYFLKKTFLWCCTVKIKTINVVLQYRGWSKQICYTFPLRCLPYFLKKTFLWCFTVKIKTSNVVLQYRGWSKQICYTFPLRCLPYCLKKTFLWCCTVKIIGFSFILANSTLLLLTQLVLDMRAIEIRNMIRSLRGWWGTF